MSLQKTFSGLKLTGIKRLMILLLPGVFLTAGSCVKGQLHYSSPGSYALSLYGINATSSKDVKKSESGFLRIDRNGKVNWIIKIKKEGKYQLRLLYPCDDPHVAINIGFSNRSFAFSLPATAGYY